MLTTMEPHSLQLGYRWSPTKCRVIKAPTPTVFKIYNQIIPEAQSFPYLGVSFNNQDSYKIDLINNATEITVQACLNNLTIHPIFKLPMTRRERRRLLRENITVMLQLGQNDGV
ncbi:hypothetical protein V8B55DRAFT_1589780 [Mucor lusitanicus]